MATPKTSTQPDVSAWQVESLRMTGFAPIGTAIQAETWWEKVVGTAPESRTIKPRQPSFREEGKHLGGKLVLSVEKNRVDWILAVDLDPSKEFSGVPALGSYPDTLESFVALIDRWMQLSPPLIRLASGEVLLLPASNRAAAYSKLGEYLHSVKLDPIGSSEFAYSINRPRVSTVIPGLTLNRLTRWSSMLVQELSVQIGVAPVATVSGGFHTCRLEIDANTAAERAEELPKEKLQSVFHELVEVGKEIAAKGDVP